MSRLQRRLSAGQLSMIAIGGAIGTGLFLGSGFAISLAGPSVLLSYAIGALIAFLLMNALAEMTVTHPDTGSFGWLAGRYVGRMAGYLVRYAYWFANVLAVGTEVTAIALYMRLWAPGVPGWYWIAAAGVMLVGVNALGVRLFGTIESVFSWVKILAIVMFLGLGSWTILNPAPDPVQSHPVNGLFPHGLSGTWIAVVVAIFSYMGIETIAVAAGETEHPDRAIRSALRSTIGRLVFFYLATIAVMLAVMPWTQAGTGASPFVAVMAHTGVPYAASIMNGVVLIAALSAMNSQIYAASRMLYSLADAGEAPSWLGRVDRAGVPLPALLLSSLGIALAALLYVAIPDRAFAAMIALSMFGALFTWGTIFLTHLFFRTKSEKRRSTLLTVLPWGSLLGILLIAAILLTTALTPTFRLTLACGLPMLAVLAVIYRLLSRKSRFSPR